MATEQLKHKPIESEKPVMDRKEMESFLRDLLEAVHLQAKEIERLTTHVEQHTKGLVPPSQMPMVVSELSGLHARLQHSEKGATCCSKGASQMPAELRGQRIPTKDMDRLC